MEKTLNRSSEMEEFAKDVLDFALEKKEKNEAFFIRLQGDLGAGKTTFCKAVGKHLGVTENMQSPTFVLQKIYKTKHNTFKTLIHIDAYRIEKIEEAHILALSEIEKDENALVLIEWPEKIEELIPKIGAVIDFEHIDNTTRKVTLKMYGKK
ncbi:MAG TPA: tRNA (adenosine(37)-N6)-threonylcarbamoyltransferase complex ATPase subunit type 1 TsaE [Candidatus Paceibacterota bacterium]|nr:tRNA (adenosine(37)-N6)-threonylcarbamoyltransferase complex ATPase subunit type 1 TsaE [Candidatus Paceibacterota bacterium]